MKPHSLIAPCPGSCGRAERGIDVLTGDPGRRYLPADGLVELASYDVRTTTELEDLGFKQGRVFALRPDDATSGR